MSMSLLRYRLLSAFLIWVLLAVVAGCGRPDFTPVTPSEETASDYGRRAGWTLVYTKSAYNWVNRGLTKYRDSRDKEALLDLLQHAADVAPEKHDLVSGQYYSEQVRVPSDFVEYHKQLVSACVLMHDAIDQGIKAVEGTQVGYIEGGWIETANEAWRSLDLIRTRLLDYLDFWKVDELGYYRDWQFEEVWDSEAK